MSGQNGSSAAVAVEARSPVREEAKRSLLTAASVLGAVAMTACCIVPLVLFSLGFATAWIGNLSALYPYRWAFFLVTAIFLGFGFYWVYWRPKLVACEPGGYCGSPLSDRINRIALWSATVIIVVALAFPYYFPYLAPILFES